MMRSLFDKGNRILLSVLLNTVLSLRSNSAGKTNIPLSSDFPLLTLDPKSRSYNALKIANLIIVKSFRKQPVGS